MQVKNQVDFTAKALGPDGKTNYALYLPAISGFYTDQLARTGRDPEYIPSERMPKGLENGVAGLDFLRKEDSYFHYKWGLYSAGHAELNLTKCARTDPMIHLRDRENTVIVGDSGGFQIATGVLKIDWATIKTSAGDPLRESILRFLEHTADWSMTLDVPAIAATPSFTPKTGLSKFEDTLDVTLYNLHYFIKNRVPGATKFLNVISGTTFDNADTWYQAVKPFSDPAQVEAMGYTADRTFEGFAFAGIHMRNLKLALKRILDLKDDGLLQRAGWIHFLGLGRLDWACFLTAVQREIRKNYNPDLQISFDAASPFVATAHGQVYTYNSFTNKRFIYSMSPTMDRKDMEGNYSKMPFLSPIMDRLTVHDMNPLSRAHAVVQGQHRFDLTEEETQALIDAGIEARWQPDRLNKLGKSGKTAWDTATYLFYMAHNLYQHIEAVQEANRIADFEYDRLKPNWRDWTKDRKTAKAVEISEYVPAAVLYFKSFVSELFALTDRAQQDQMIQDFSAMLDQVSFGPAGEHNFSSLFTFEDLNDEEAVDVFADMNDEKLVQIEQENKDV